MESKQRLLNLDEPFLSRIRSPATDSEVRSELEEILTNDDLPRLRRIRLATATELRTLFKLASPTVIIYLLNNVISMSTQILCGHLGNLQLVAATLGNTDIQIFTYGVMHDDSRMDLRDLRQQCGCKYYISNIFTSVADLSPYLAVALVLNGIHPVLSGVAVGCGWQTIVAYLNIGRYYLVGIRLGCFLGFKFNLSAKGIWTGMLGGTTLQTIILIFITARTD